MKLFVIAALVAMAAADSLENPERSYLPIDSSNKSISASSSNKSLEAESGTTGAGRFSCDCANASSTGTTSKPLPSDNGPSASNSAPDFNSSLQDSAAKNLQNEQDSGPQVAPAQKSAASSSQVQLLHQAAAASRQYPALKSRSFQSPSQQAFDEETGYHYGAPQSVDAESLQGVGAQNFRSQQSSGRQATSTPQYASLSSQYKSPQAASSFVAPSYEAQFPQKSAATSRQYAAPRNNYLQNPPQQAFDEQTEYHYGARPQFSESVSQRLGAQNFHSQQYNGRQVAPAQQYAAPSPQFGSPQAASLFHAPSYQAQFPQQSGPASQQYLAPKTSSFQNYPQQAFDEQTGYHY